MKKTVFMVCILLTELGNQSDVDDLNGTADAAGTAITTVSSSSSYTIIISVTVPVVVLILCVGVVLVLCRHKQQGQRPRLRWGGLATKESIKLGKHVLIVNDKYIGQVIHV